MQEKIDKIRYDLSRFIYGHRKLLFNFLVNSTQKIELKRAFKDFSELISSDAIKEFKQIKSNFKPSKGNLDYIESALIHYFLDAESIDLSSSLTQQVGTKKEWLTLLTSNDRMARLQALDSLSRELDNFTPDCEELWKIWVQSLTKIQIPSLKIFALNYLQNADAEANNLAVNLINSTDKLYTILLEKFANSFQLNAKNLTYADLLSAINFTQVSNSPPPQLASKCLNMLLEELHISHLLENINYILPPSIENVKLLPCDYICPLFPVDKTYIFPLPALNFSNYKRTFFTFGKAAIYAAIDNNLPIEYIHFGDDSIRYTFGYLFDALLDSNTFQTCFFSPKNMSISPENLLFAKLVMLRKIAAQAIYESKIIHFSFDFPISSLAHEFNNIMTPVLQTEIPSSFFLFGRDHHFSAIHALRGMACAYLLIEHLQNTYGSKWFTNKKAGYFLLELLECGTSYKLNEIIKDWGFPELSINPKNIVNNICPNISILL